MSKELVRAGQKYLAESSDQSLKKDVAEFSLTTGVGGLVLWGVAGFLPFITLPMLLVILTIAGGWLYIKS